MRPASKRLGAFLAACALVAAAAATEAAGSDTPVYRHRVINVWPHDAAAFTQGLVYADGVFYESTGGYGRSSLRQVDPESGRVIRRRAIPARYFAEGIALVDDRIFMLTWRSGRGFVYDRRTLARIGEFRYDGEGWGLATDGRLLIMSDGTAMLRFIDPVTLRVQRTLAVHERGRPVINLNELEYVRGEIYANVWLTDRIARIDAQSGAVLGWIDLTGLHDAADPDAVPNGIAYDGARDRLFVTGKLWPRMFEIRLTPASDSRSR